MAQTYYPSRIASPVKQAFHESVFGGLHGDKQLNVEDVEEAYVESKDRWVVVWGYLTISKSFQPGLRSGLYQGSFDRHSGLQ